MSVMSRSIKKRGLAAPRKYEAVRLAQSFGHIQRVVLVVLMLLARYSCGFSPRASAGTDASCLRRVLVVGLRVVVRSSSVATEAEGLAVITFSELGSITAEPLIVRPPEIVVPLVVGADIVDVPPPLG